MVAEQRILLFEDLAAHLDAIFDRIAANGEEITVERDGNLFALRPRRRRRHRRKGGPVTADDPLWDIAGIGRSQGPTDVSSNKYKYVVDAIASHFEHPGGTQEQPSLAQESAHEPARGMPTSPHNP